MKKKTTRSTTKKKTPAPAAAAWWSPKSKAPRTKKRKAPAPAQPSIALRPKDRGGLRRNELVETESQRVAMECAVCQMPINLLPSEQEKPIGEHYTPQPVGEPVAKDWLKTEKPCAGSTMLAVMPTAAPPALRESMRSYIAASTSNNTRRTYQSQFGEFEKWCKQTGHVALPATMETVAAFLTSRADAGAKPASLDVMLSAIGAAHRAKGEPDPRASELVRVVRRGIRRTVPTAKRKVRAITVEMLRAISTGTGDSLVDIRDRAMLLLGFAGALRRSELVAIDAGDLVAVDQGLRLKLRRSKTDQEAEGIERGIPFGDYAATCPVRAVQAWRAASGITEGALFRTVRATKGLGERLGDKDVSRIVKRHIKAIGLDPAEFSGHSLRAGLVTAAAKAKRPLAAIRRQTGHLSDRMVEEYVRDVQILDEDNAARGIGL